MARRPLFYFPEATIQRTIGEPNITAGSNDSVIEVYFSTAEAPKVFAPGRSRGRHTWNEVFGH